MSAKFRKILLSGYYGFDNAGDEAVLASLCDILRGKLPNVELVALSAKPEATAAAYDIRAINRWDKAALRTELAECALFCSGGGSLLQDVTSVRSVWYYTSLLRQAQKQGVPTIVLAQGLGPLRTKAGRWLAGRALSKCRLLSWRDAASERLAAEILPPAQKTIPSYVVCDPVLLWQPTAGDSSAVADGEELTVAAQNIKVVALALRPWRNMQPAAAACLVQLLREQNFQPVLLPYHLGEDEKLAEQINAALTTAGQEPAAVWRCATPQEAWTAVGRADLLLGMRLHSLIMAAAQGVPVLAFSYDPKVEAFARMAAMPLASAGDLQPDSVLAQLNALPAKPQAYPLAPLLGSWPPLLAAINRILAEK